MAAAAIWTWGLGLAYFALAAVAAIVAANVRGAAAATAAKVDAIATRVPSLQRQLLPFSVGGVRLAASFFFVGCVTVVLSVARLDLAAAASFIALVLIALVFMILARRDKSSGRIRIVYPLPVAAIVLLLEFAIVALGITIAANIRT